MDTPQEALTAAQEDQLPPGENTARQPAVRRRRVRAQDSVLEELVDRPEPEKPPESQNAQPGDDQAVQGSSEVQVPRSLLSIDIGGTKIKVLATGQTEPRKITSGRRMTPSRMVSAVRELVQDWEFEAISIGYPGMVGSSGPRAEPGNLGSGWVGFDFAAAFEKPVRIINDAAMQALGSYEGGRMLFLGLGTGLGAALIANGSIISLELGQIPHTGGRPLGEILGRSGLNLIGKKAWREILDQIIPAFMGAFLADYVVLGGGNSKLVKQLPPGVRLGHNLTAFRGGFRLWHLEDLPTLSAGNAAPIAPASANWRLI